MSAPNDGKSWLLTIIRAVMGHAMYWGQYPARIVTQRENGTLDVIPDDQRMPPMTEVPIRYGVPGIAVKVDSGRVLVSFENGDPRYPVATLWDGGVVRELKITVTTKVILDCPDVCLGDENGAPVARVGDVVEIVFPPASLLAGVVGTPPATQPLTGTVTITDVLLGVITSGGSKARAS